MTATASTSHAAEPRTAAKAALPVGVEFLWMNPADLIVDANVRTHLDITPEFRQSIRDLGVRVPVTAVRSADGIKVREGQQRTITATEEKVPGIPVYVVPDGGDVERIIGQLAENHDRTAMIQKDTAGAYEQLALLGCRPRRSPSGSAAPGPRSQPGSPSRSPPPPPRRPGNTPWNLTDAALFAEFDGDQQATEDLRYTAERGGSLIHTAQRIRDARDRSQAVAAERDRLTAEGVTITHQPGYYEATTRREVTALRAKGSTEPLTAEQHATCPHHAAYVRYDDDTATAEAVYLCTDYKAAGHLKWTDPAEKVERTPLCEDERVKRRQVRENNAAWRSAETVRREWLPTLACRKTPPKGGAEFIAHAVVQCPSMLTNAAFQGHALAARLLGFRKDFGGSRYVADLLDKANTPRSQVITLVVVLAAIEESTGTHTWRQARPGDTATRYLTALEGWGYGLSDIEQTTCGRTPTPDPDAAAA